MDIKEIIALMEAVSENGLTTLELEHGDTRIKMKREPEKTGTESMAVRQIVREYENVDSMVYTESGNRITCPLVGTFYSAPAPDAEDFVKEMKLTFKEDCARLGITGTADGAANTVDKILLNWGIL